MHLSEVVNSENVIELTDFCERILEFKLFPDKGIEEYLRCHFSQI